MPCFVSVSAPLTQSYLTMLEGCASYFFVYELCIVSNSVDYGDDNFSSKFNEITKCIVQGHERDFSVGDLVSFTYDDAVIR